MLFALNAEDGALEWKTHLYPLVSSTATIAIADAIIFAHGREHVLAMVDQETGELLGSEALSSGDRDRYSSPAVTSGGLYRRVFHVTPDGRVLVPVNGTAYVSTRSHLHARPFGLQISPSTLPSWNYEVEVYDFTPIIHEDLVITAESFPSTSRIRSWRAVKRIDGTEAWSRDVSGTTSLSDAAVADGKLFVFEGSSIRAISIDTGAQAWRHDLSVWPKGAPAVVGSSLYYVAGDDKVNARKVSDGSLIWSADIAQGAADGFGGGTIAADQGLLIISHYGRVYAFESSPSSP